MKNIDSFYFWSSYELVWLVMTKENKNVPFNLIIALKQEGKIFII